MKNIFTVLLVTFSVLIVNGQNNIATSNVGDGFKTFRKGTKGHQFLLDEWVDGYLVENSGKLTEKKLLNYDIHFNKPTYKLDRSVKDVMVLDRNLYSGFILLDAKSNRYIFSKVEGSKFAKSKKEDKYYQLINAPGKNIILESSKKLKDPNASGWTASSNNNLAAKFVMKSQYYVLNKNNMYVKVKLSSGSISKALKDKKKEVKAFIKSKGLKLKSTDDLIQIMNYYATL